MPPTKGIKRLGIYYRAVPGIYTYTSPQLHYAEKITPPSTGHPGHRIARGGQGLPDLRQHKDQVWRRPHGDDLSPVVFSSGL